MTDSSGAPDAPSRAARAGNTRTMLTVSAALSAAGITLAAIGDAAIGRWLVAAGSLGLIVGLHRYGRLGADPPLDFAD